MIKYDYDLGVSAPFQTKLIDFGLGVVIQKGQQASRFMGTIAFLSPEVISGK